MSEYSVEAYFISKETIKNSFGSKDKNLLDRVLKDKSRIIKTFQDRFDEKTLAEAVADSINGKREGDHQFHYAFAAWAIVAAAAEGRPKKPSIGAPFISLYDFCDVLEEQDTFPKLLKVFQTLNGDDAKYGLPLKPSINAQIPGFAYLESKDLRAMLKEITQLKNDIEEETEDSWTLDIEETDDLIQILDWLIEAEEKQQSICLVMEGDL
jgi:hypothetical protein